MEAHCRCCSQRYSEDCSPFPPGWSCCSFLPSGVAAAFGVCVGVAAEFGSEGTAVANKCFEEALSYACTGGELAFDERTQVVLLHFTQNYSCDLLAPTY